MGNDRKTMAVVGLGSMGAVAKVYARNVSIDLPGESP